jgi:hypothetical protein
MERDEVAVATAHSREQPGVLTAREAGETHLKWSVDTRDRVDMADKHIESDTVGEDEGHVGWHEVELRVESATDVCQVGIHLRGCERDDGAVCWHAAIALARGDRRKPPITESGPRGEWTRSHGPPGPAPSAWPAMRA